MLFRNSEVKKEALLYALLTTFFSVTGLFFDSAILVFCVCVCLGCLHFISSYHRYKRIQRLSEALDELLTAGKTLSIQEYREGELSILSNQIQKMTKRLTEAADALQTDKAYLADSLADISHQLRTPLTAMNLTAAMLAASDITQERRQELTMELKNLLRRTQWLVESLLKMSKLDAGTVKLERKEVPVSDLIRRAAAPLAIPMDVRSQTLRIECFHEVILCDLTWTAEALGNLLKNCSEHTPEGGSITVSVENTALFTQITVEDTGPGFVPEDIPHLFERFYKGKNAADSSYGIGLALSRTIVTAQNGTIQAMNTSNGARFVLKFYEQVI